MSKLPIGKWLITLVGFTTMWGAYIADWNTTHIFNPNWPPHAKFYNAQTMLFGSVLGLLCLWLLWGQRGKPRITLRLAVLLGSLYWLTQAGAILFPGTALADPEFDQPRQGPVQFYFDAGLLAMLGVGYALETARFDRRPAAG